MRKLARDRPWFEVFEGGHETSPPVPETTKWPLMGYCAASDIRDWFRVTDVEDEVAVLAAKAVCELCIVRGPCLEFGLNLPEASDFAVWGGTTPEERVVIRHRIADQVTDA